MDIPEDMCTTQARLESFSAPHHLAKRRASTTKKKGGAASVTWLHADPTPSSLARAGFYFKPSANSEDRCQCFLCGVKLDGWEHGDDPIQEHAKHSPECAWAINTLIQQKFEQGENVDADPMDEQFVEARTNTFGTKWPHENKKGWKPKIAKMVAAGWTYDPSPEYDDGVTCMYCGLSLDGWEPKDDPAIEHRKRGPDCPFFRLLNEWESARKQTKTLKGMAKRGSRATRLSSQSMVSVASDVPSHQSFDLDEPAVDEDSILTSATNATVTSSSAKGRRKKAPAKTAKKATRGKKITTGDLDIGPGEDQPALRKADTTAIEEPPKRYTRRKASQEEQSSHIEDVLGASQTKRSAKSSGRTKQCPRMSADESQLHTEMQAAIDSSIISTQASQKIMRGTKRMSDGAPKSDSSILITNNGQMESQEQDPVKPKRGKKAVSKPKSPSEAIEAVTREIIVDSSEILQHVTSPLAPTPYTDIATARKATCQTTEIGMEIKPVVEVQMGTVQPTDIKDDMRLLECEVEREEDEFDFGQSLSNPSNPYALIHGTPDHYFRQEASPAPSTPTPARVYLSTVTSSASKKPLPAPPLSAAREVATAGNTTLEALENTTPIASPKESPRSDIENKPPSARPASIRPPLSVQRIPLASSTPIRQPQLSPSKRMIGALNSTLPWEPSDLGSILSISPVKRNLEDSASLSGVALENLDAVHLREVVHKVKGFLSSAEKSMSVEEWVRWNAGMGEERLRSECEALVMKFEIEGGRALRSLEGLDCI